MKRTDIKIAYIGGGSRYWARDLLSELAQSSTLTGQVDLYDIDLAAARRNVAVAEAVFARPEARARFVVRARSRLADALRGADFVVLSIEPGPTTMRYADLEIPARFGIVQPVGDTTGPGGIARALRAVPLYIDFAAQIMRHCPRAWVMNYTNPMTLCVAALHAAAPGIKAFGCCHEVFHTQTLLATLAARWFGGPVPSRRAISVDVAGINHFTWITAASWQGRDLMPQLREQVATPPPHAALTRRARAKRGAGRWFDNEGAIAFDLLRRFGALGAAGDRHLAEFVPWYARSEQELHRWGVIVTPYSYREQRARRKDHPLSFYRDRPLAASDEEGVHQIEALVGGAPLETNVNLPNLGQVVGLPPGHVVETYARFRAGKVTPISAQPLPAGALALVRRVADVQALTLQAALARDPELAFQALLADPLVALPTDQAWQMFVAMLRHLRPALRDWRVP